MAASASTSPQPKWLLGRDPTPPHREPLLTVTFGFAVMPSSCFVAVMSLTSVGRADQSRATAPTTWGPAIEAPEKNEYAESLPFVADRTLTPGATMSGLMRPEPSIVTGPRLLNPARTLLLLTAPVEKAAS